MSFMKSLRQPTSVFFLIIVIGTISIAIFVNYTALGRTSISEKSTNAEIPVYPTAYQVVDEHSSKLIETGALSYLVNSTIDEVGGFYLDRLRSNGWLLDSDLKETGVTEAKGRVMDFSLPNQASHPYAAKYLELTIMSAAEARTKVFALYGLRPNVDMLPLFEDADHIETRWDRDIDYGFPERITSYISQSSIKDVETFYYDIMPRNGWELVDNQDMTFTNTRFSYGIVIALSTSTATSASSTHVEMKLSGTGIMP